MTNLSYQVVRSSKRKKLTITVERDCTIVVHAPTITSDEMIEKIVASKRQWILEKINHPQKYTPRPPAPGKEVVNGESALYLGREYRIEIDTTCIESIQFARHFLIPSGNQQDQRHMLKEWYITQAKETILPRVDRFARELGVSVALVKIVDNRYRWGSCTVNDNVNFNWRLIKAPMFVIEYVIYHELAHLLEANHTPRFWNIIRAKIPTADKAKNWLKVHGQLLEEEL